MSPEHLPEQNIPKSLDTDRIKPEELANYNLIISLGRAQVMSLDFDWQGKKDEIMKEYDDLTTTVQGKIDIITSVDKADTTPTDEEMIAPGSISSIAGTIMMHCVNQNFDAAEEAHGALAASLGSPEEIAVYNQMTPLVDALRVINKAKETE